MEYGGLLEMCTYGQLIGYCTRGNEQGGFLPKQSSYVGLKSSSIRLVIDVISKRGLNSVLVHLLRGNWEWYRPQTYLACLKGSIPVTVSAMFENKRAAVHADYCSTLTDEGPGYLHPVPFVVLSFVWPQ